jgi:hypothetical protein
MAKHKVVASWPELDLIGVFAHRCEEGLTCKKSECQVYPDLC